MDFLRVPPANRLEQLRGDREGQWSIRITAILNGQRSITADTALRLARYFNTTPQSWLNLQKNYELEVAQRRVGSVIADEIEPRAA